MDDTRIVDNVELVICDDRGRIRDRVTIHNVVTTAGKAGVADQLIPTPTLAKAGWIAVGTGTPSATLLGAEIARVAVAPPTSRAAAVVTYQATFAAGVATGSLTEAGTFDAAAANGPNMWMSATFAAIPKLAGDSLAITWTLTLA